MYENSVWETLQAVEQVEVSFNQTLKNIRNINKRYKTVSALKKQAQKRQDSFEAEIQAAITGPSYSKTSKVSKKASKNKKHKVIRKIKRVPTSKFFQGMKYIESPFLLPPTLSDDKVSEMAAPFLCVHTKSVYEIHNTSTTTTTQMVPRKPYRNMIRQLYRAARQKTQKDSRMREQDQALCPDCSISCSCSCFSSTCVCS
ncbi:uncharacterized protein [Drosophila bipectinata]|uniref:uncharacterized protein n=1 Tax=Drosophila bipectinata TaxID=42026 RepID=UPI0038B3A958